jgi:two-component SAPR family response regulator
VIDAIVVDDEWYIAEEISDMVEQTGFMRVVGKYQDPVKVLEDVAGISPRVAFIDIEMPEMDGITLAEKLLEKDPSMLVAFITSWNQYAVQAFDLNALDYVMKPVRVERFNRMVEKIRRELSLQAPESSGGLKIRCFSQLEASIGGIPVKWMRAKAEELFAYLLMNHGNYIHKELIIEQLWPGYDPARALPILQTSICRIRNVFAQVRGSVTLDYSGSRYCLMITNVQCDYLDVERALANYTPGDEATYAAVEKACDLFGEGFLAQHGYLWSLEKDESLRRRLVLALQGIISGHSRQTRRETARLSGLLAALTAGAEEVDKKLLKMRLRDLETVR